MPARRSGKHDKAQGSEEHTRSNRSGRCDSESTLLAHEILLRMELDVEHRLETRRPPVVDRLTYRRGAVAIQVNAQAREIFPWAGQDFMNRGQLWQTSEVSSANLNGSKCPTKQERSANSRFLGILGRHWWLARIPAFWLHLWRPFSRVLDPTRGRSGPSVRLPLQPARRCGGIGSASRKEQRTMRHCTDGPR